MEPFEITDHDGARVGVRECGQDEHGYLYAEDEHGTAVSVCVRLPEIGALAAELYRACGKTPPAMPGRPDPGCRPADSVNARFAASMRLLRQEQQVSPAQLAKSAGVAKDTVLKLERGTNGVSLRVADSIATALGTTVGAMTDAGVRCG